MPAHCPSIGTGTRVVVVQVPRANCAAGRVLSMIDANPDTPFTPEQIAGRLGVNDIFVRQALIQLTGKGLVESTPSAVRRGRKPVMLYRLATDYSAHVAGVLKQGERR